LRAGDPVVVGEEEGGEPQLTTPSRNLEWCDIAIKRRRAMKVEVNPDNGAACMDRQVRYYR
jgi:hypothetical protein